MKKSVFRAELLDGHKGPAVLVPFDPAKTWGLAPTTIYNPTYGKSSGHVVSGTMNGRRFEGWIGQRWGKHFILVDAALQKAARVKVGDVVAVSISPNAARKQRTRATSEQPRRAAAQSRRADSKSGRTSTQSGRTVTRSGRTVTRSRRTAAHRK